MEKLSEDVRQLADKTVQEILTIGGGTRVDALLSAVADAIDEAPDADFSDLETASQFMDLVLTDEVLAHCLGQVAHPFIIRGYLSAFPGMYTTWKHSDGSTSRDTFLAQSARLFTHGLEG